METRLQSDETISETEFEGAAEANTGPDNPLWHAEGIDKAFQRLGVDRSGLTAEETAQRLARYGPNALPAAKGRSVLRRFLAQFNNVLIYVLLGASAVTLLLGHIMDAGVILAVVLVNAAIGFWQEGKAENALAAVQQMLSPSASVIRSGSRGVVDAADLVPGDIVLIDAGDRVPADLRLFQTSALRVEEAALTGESAPSDKAVAPVAEDAPLGERSSMAFSGTMVAAGRGSGVVVATGAATEIGRIGAMLGEIGAIKTPLLAEIDRFGKLLTAVIFAVAAVIFAVAYGLRDYALADAFFAVVGMAVAGVPEGLPAVITITLALGVQAMAQRRTIVRRLPAIETLGAVSVICTDKTGTLTKNEMVVRTLAPAGASAPIAVSGEGYAPDGTIAEVSPAVVALARTGALCNDAEIVADADGTWTVAGDPMDGALLALQHKTGETPSAVRERHPRLAEQPFDSLTRYAATLNGDDGERATIHVKGAATRVLAMCQTEDADDKGTFDRAHWEVMEDTIAGEGQRVLAFASKSVAQDADIAAEVYAGGFTLLGLAGFIDPPRPEAVDAIAECHAAGIDVKMITGDHKTTALAIAGELGLSRGEGALTGADIDTMDEAALADAMRRVDVFARAAPEHKLRLVEAFQANGNVIAMTGDGVNDAPALKRADVGVAMGIKGTEAAKEAAQVVLTDDNFATIAAAVREGRTIADNIRKVIAWTLPTNGGESFIIIGAILVGLTLPITPVQILWINMITAVALGLTLAFDPPQPDVMRRPPRPAAMALVDRETLWRIFLVSALMAGCVFGVHALSLSRGDTAACAHTLGVNTVVAIEIAYLFAVREGAGGWLWLFVGTRAVWTGIAFTLLAQALFTYAPPLQSVFGTAALAAQDVAGLVALVVVATLVLHAERWARHKLQGEG